MRPLLLFPAASSRINPRRIEEIRRNKGRAAVHSDVCGRGFVVITSLLNVSISLLATHVYNAIAYCVLPSSRIEEACGLISYILQLTFVF